MPDIFLSYSRKDRARVERLVEVLSSKGWSVWWDTKLRTGEVFDDKIQRTLAEAKCVVVAWSRNSTQSMWVRAEAYEAQRRGILVPFLLEDAEPPLPFRQIETRNLTSWNGKEETAEIRRLIEDIAALIETEGQPSDDSNPEVRVPAVPPRGTDKKRKEEGRRMWLSVGLAAALLLSVGGFAGSVWWLKVKSRVDESAIDPQQTWAEVEERVGPAVVSIECHYRLRLPGSPMDGLSYQVRGSGAQIRPGLILTALHVVEPWRFVLHEWDELARRNHLLKAEYDVLEIQFPGQQPLNATLVASSRNQDLALLQVMETVAPVVSIASSNSDIKMADEIAVLGYPGELRRDTEIKNGGSGPTFIRGTVSRPLTATGENSSHLFFDASIAPGSSGGPVVNQKGELIGVVTLQFQQASTVEILGQQNTVLTPVEAGSVAVPPKEIMAFLRKSGIVQARPDA